MIASISLGELLMIAGGLTVWVAIWVGLPA